MTKSSRQIAPYDNEITDSQCDLEGEWISRQQAENEDRLKAEKSLHEMRMASIESETRLNTLRSLNDSLSGIGALLF